MGRMDSAINYHATFKIGTVESVEEDKYTVSLKSTGGSVSEVTAANGTYMVGDSVMLTQIGGNRNMLCILFLSPYA